MPNVIAFPSGDEPGSSKAGDQPGLRRWACYAMWLVTTMLGLTALFTVTVLALGLIFQGALLWLAPGMGFVGARPEGISGAVAFGALPWPTRMAYAVNFAATQIPILALLSNMRALFGDLAIGTVFAAGHISCLRRMALWLLAYAVAPVAGQALVRIVGHGVDLGWFRSSSVHALLIAVVLVVFAELMRAGQAIKDERDGFI